MGIVIRKSLLTTFLSYVGIVIGYLNLLYFFPRFLSPSQIGLYRLVLDTGLLLAPFAQAGIMQGIIKFYPTRQERVEQKELAYFSSLFLICSLLVFTLALILFKNQILSLLFSQNKEEVAEYYNLLILLVVTLSLLAFFEGFARANISIVLVNFLKDVVIRLLTTISIFLYLDKWLDFDGLVYSLLAIYGLATLILFIQTIRTGQFSIRFSLRSISFNHIREIIKYNFYMVISAGSNLVVGKVDSLMISALLGLAENGIYQIMFFVAVVIDKPKIAISQVAISLFSKEFAQSNLQEIKKLYYKTALNQLIIGLLIYIGIVINLENMYFFIPNGEVYKAGRWVVIIIGASRVLDMASGANGELIVMSKHYQFNVVAIAFLAFLTVVSNYFLIPAFGINGAAIASFISLFIFNLIKFLFIFKKFGFIPFNQEQIKVIAIGIAVFIIGHFIPALSNHFLDLIIRSAIVTILYSVLIVQFKASPDINNFLFKTFRKWRK